MKRVSISDGVRWTSEVSMASRNWVRSVEALQSAAYGVIEDFKLDLELPNDAQIGRIYDQDQRLIFSADLLSIFGGAREDVFLIDPYMDVDTFSIYFGNNPEFKSRILLGKGVEGVRALARKVNRPGFTGDCLVLLTRLYRVCSCLHRTPPQLQLV